MKTPNEKLVKTILEIEFTIRFQQFLIELERKRRIEVNKAIYDIFTPAHIKLWNRITKKKPYLEPNYKPKI